MKNMKTTVAGVVTAVGVLLVNAGGFMQGTEYSTEAMIGAVMTIAGILGWSWFTRDADKSNKEDNDQKE